MTPMEFAAAVSSIGFCALEVARVPMRYLLQENSASPVAASQPADQRRPCGRADVIFVFDWPTLTRFVAEFPQANKTFLIRLILSFAGGLP